MLRRKWLGGPAATALAVLALCAAASARPATAGTERVLPAPAIGTFHTRLGGALGIMPPAGRQALNPGDGVPLVYHGGPVMRSVTIHTLFWVPPGYKFDGSPAAGTPGYVSLIQQFFTDVAHDSGSAASFLSLIRQYGDTGGSATYNVRYSASADSIIDLYPYPLHAQQCASPAGVATCVTDGSIQRELDRWITARDPSGRGLSDLWFVFLPPDVDTCVLPDQCGSNAFAGYHSLSNLGHGPAIYSVVPDPLIELAPPPGSDPQGNPEAESAIDTAAHELLESITDPQGTGWMDPDGFEVGDKCETGPELGAPLGYAADGSPYNQVINGHQYLIQAMWSNSGGGCVQRVGSSNPPPSLPTIDLTQFSAQVRGNTGIAAAGVSVRLALYRARAIVASGHATTRADGSWGPVTLSGRHGARHAVGDDRDQLGVLYGPGGPPPDLIQTGNGGNPFAQSGWTGWFDLDNGYAVSGRAIRISPCIQTGVLGVTVSGLALAPPVENCQGDVNVALVGARRIGPGTAVAITSTDNRAVSPFAPAGAMVKLTIAPGEPRSVSALGNNQIVVSPTGFPLCTAALDVQVVSCNGLVPGARYTLLRRRGSARATARADGNGAIRIDTLPGPLRVAGGDVLVLRNHAGRVLTMLHVAHLRVAVDGQAGHAASGTCQAGDYWGKPLSAPPTGDRFGMPGASGKGMICPQSGGAKGLPVRFIEQTDDFSGGLTRTSAPAVSGFSPAPDATLYGPFTATASPRLSGDRVALTITPAEGSSSVFSDGDVSGPGGVTVDALAPGIYTARWVVSDINGDTRTLVSRFVEAP